MARGTPGVCETCGGKTSAKAYRRCKACRDVAMGRPLCPRCRKRPRSLLTRSGGHPDWCATCRRAEKVKALCLRCGRPTGHGGPRCFECFTAFSQGESPLGVRPMTRLPPPEPTDARPGSEEKIAVLCWRAEREMLLWHPKDAKE